MARMRAASARKRKALSQERDKNIDGKLLQKYINVERFGKLGESQGCNPIYVKLIAKSRIKDGHLKCLLSLLTLPLQLVIFFISCYQYKSISKVLYALFGIVEASSGQIRICNNIQTKKLSSSDNNTQKNNKTKKLKIAIISDTHGLHNSFSKENFPKGDILIHTGDASNFGTIEELKDFASWFASLPNFKYKIFVPGNHDMLFDTEFYDVFQQEWHFKKDSTDEIKMFMKKLGIIVLIDESIIIENIKFYGSPWTIIEHPWQTGFQLTADKMEAKWKLIEKDTDILLTHCPPYSIGDKCIFGGKSGGCKKLLQYVRDEIKPLIHIFGHEHGDPGIFPPDTDRNDSQIYFANAASVSEYYRLRQSPIVFSLIPKQ